MPRPFCPARLFDVERQVPLTCPEWTHAGTTAARLMDDVCPRRSHYEQSDLFVISVANEKRLYCTLSLLLYCRAIPTVRRSALTALVLSTGRALIHRSLVVLARVGCMRRPTWQRADKVSCSQLVGSHERTCLSFVQMVSALDHTVISSTVFLTAVDISVVSWAWTACCNPASGRDQQRTSAVRQSLGRSCRLWSAPSACETRGTSGSG